jgi:diguanylate cyclase
MAVEQNPYLEDQEQASEYLRLALALLSKHHIPMSPLNYRMGYDCVSGKSEDLKKAFDEVAAPVDKSLTERLWELYQNFYVLDGQALENIRHELKSIIMSMQGDIERSGGKLSGYADKLDRFAAMLNASPTPQAMSTEVKMVIEDTRATEQSQRQFNAQLMQITQDMEFLRKELAQIREESYIDSLTGISNRKAFDAALEEAVQKTRSTRSTFTVLIADVDHFKQVNDNYGHLIGDKVLRFVASTLKWCVKGKDLVSRFGGEEFAVILMNTDVTGAYSVAEQIRRAIHAGKIKDLNSQKMLDQVTISIGIAQFDSSDLPNDLLQRADQALYQAKAKGRNRVEIVK